MKNNSKPGIMETVATISWVTYLGILWPVMIARNKFQILSIIIFILLVGIDIYIYMRRKFR